MSVVQSKKARDVESEYGMPFWEIVKGFANDGESIHATGKLLGYKSGAFHRLVIRHNKTHLFKHWTKTNGYKSAQQSKTPAKIASIKTMQKTAHAMNPNYKWVIVDDVRDTIAGHAKRCGVSRFTVYQRLRRGLSISDALFVGDYRNNGQWVND